MSLGGAVGRGRRFRLCTVALLLSVAAFCAANPVRSAELEDGLAALSRERFADAERLLASAIAKAERAGGGAPLARALTARAEMFLQIGRLELATADAQRALWLAGQAATRDGVETARASLVLGEIALETLRTRDAERLCDDVVRRAAAGALPPQIEARALHCRTEVHLQRRAFVDVTASVERARTLVAPIAAQVPSLYARILVQQARLRMDPGQDVAASEDLLVPAIQVCETYIGPTSACSMRLMALMGRMEVEWGSPQRARDAIVSALSTATARLPAEHPVTTMLLLALASSYVRDEHLDEAEAVITELDERCRDLYGTESHQFSMVLELRAATLVSRGQPQQAVELFRQVVALRADLLGYNAPVMIDALENTAAALRAAGGLEEAREIQAAVDRARAIERQLRR